MEAANRDKGGDGWDCDGERGLQLMGWGAAKQGVW